MIDLHWIRSFNWLVMKLFASSTFAFACLALAGWALPSGASAKSKLGEYYLGVSYFGGNAKTADLDVLDLEVANPVSDANDFRIGLTWMNSDLDVAGDETSWWLDFDAIYHYDDFVYGAGTFRPYFGLGIGHIDDSAHVILSDGGLNWKFLAGSEIIITDAFSALLGVNFYGLWEKFGENDIELELSVSHWFSDVHGAGLEYRHATDMEVDYLGLRYMYSWQ